MHSRSIGTACTLKVVFSLETQSPSRACSRRCPGLDHDRQAPDPRGRSGPLRPRDRRLWWPAVPLGVGDGDTTGNHRGHGGPALGLASRALKRDVARRLQRRHRLSRATAATGAIVAGASASVGRRPGPDATTPSCARSRTPPSRRRETVRPVLECVVFNADDAGSRGLGLREPERPDRSAIPVGADNRFTPNPADRGQPEVFEPGRGTWASSRRRSRRARTTLRWTLSGRDCNRVLELATLHGHGRAAQGRRCHRPILASSTCASTDRLVTSGGNGTTTGPVVVGVGEGTVSETAASGTNLADYESSVQCTRNGTVAVSVAGTKVDVAVARGDVVVCTFTNREDLGPHSSLSRRSSRAAVADAQLDLAVVKIGSVPSTVVVGQRITWTMTVTNRSSVAADGRERAEGQRSPLVRGRDLDLPEGVAGHLQSGSRAISGGSRPARPRGSSRSRWRRRSGSL